MQMIASALILGGIPFGIPLLMPGWKSLVACALLIGGPSLWILDDYRRAASQANFDDSAGAAVGAALLLGVTVWFLLGVFVRALWLVSRKIKSLPDPSQS